MKKFIMGVALVAVLALASSCGTRAPKAAETETDSTAVETEVVDSTVADTTVVAL